MEALSSGYFSQLNEFPLLSDEEILQLATKARGKKKGAPQAREKMVLHNLRLVIYIAKQFYTPNIDFADLVSEGNIGLMAAAKEYNPKLGGKFSSYAGIFIKRYIYKFIKNHSGMVRIPIHADEKIRKIKLVIDNIALRLERAPTSGEIAEELNISEKVVEEINASMFGYISINAPMGEYGSTLENIIVDEKVRSPYEVAAENIKYEDLRTLLSKLSVKDQSLIDYRFGISSNKPMSSKDTAARYNITRQGVEQACSRIFKKIKRRISLVKKVGAINSAVE